ncbi:hypothetical protein ACLB0R_09980 [Sphingomonas sp. GlSt437]|uniref:hypothetical protein n=1 Tax=Sphingomonas sp. GlSt437 TaxID=3389970 RepID=UPI003A84CF8B
MKAWRQPITLAASADGFELRKGTQSMAIAWRDIVRVVAFKRDMMTVDRMCLAFETADFAIEVDEEMPGYLDFTEAMNRALSISPEWMLRVMFPAFATNMETIFERAPVA